MSKVPRSERPQRRITDPAAKRRLAAAYRSGVSGRELTKRFDISWGHARELLVEMGVYEEGKR